MMLIQALLILGFGFSFYTYTQNEVQPQTVYVFNKDIPANTKVTTNDITPVSIPAKAINTAFVLNSKNIVGKYTATKVFAQQYVMKNQVVTADKKDPFESMDLSKLRKVSVPLSYVDGFAGNIKRGDQVDFVFTGKGTKDGESGQEGFEYSKVFLQDVYVYSVSTGDGYAFQDHSDVSKTTGANGQKISDTSSQDGLGIITFAMTYDQAEEYKTRANTGKISILGRFDASQDYSSLGYVLGDYQEIFSGNGNAETDTTSK